MAYYDITHICGHFRRVDVYGQSTEERDRKADWHRERPCKQCYYAERRDLRKAQVEENNAASAAETISMGLPALTGTKRQVGWANTIRIAYLARLVDVAAKLGADPQKVVERAAGHANASHWIDHRQKPNRRVFLSDIAFGPPKFVPWRTGGYKIDPKETYGFARDALITPFPAGAN